MKTPFIFLILIVLLQGSGCRNDDTPISEMTLITKGSFVGYGFSQEDRSITNQNDWTKFIDDYNYAFDRYGSGIITEVTIDFSKYQVLIVFDGLKGTTGYSVDITDATELENSYLIDVEHMTPKHAGSKILTQAYCIVRIPLSTKSIAFQHSCTPPWVYANLIGKGNLSGKENISKQNIVITTQSDWIGLLDQMNSFQQDPKFLSYFAKINFDESIVIAIFDDVKTSCCNSIDITDVAESEVGIDITVQNLWFGANSSIAQPFQISTVPKTSKKISFKTL